MQGHILSTEELGDVISQKISEKFPDTYFSPFRFRQGHRNLGPGTYVYSNSRKYYITYVDERGGVKTVLETDQDQMVFQCEDKYRAYDFKGVEWSGLDVVMKSGDVGNVKYLHSNGTWSKDTPDLSSK